MNNSPKEPNKDETIYPENKDWADFTVNLHDGWADDVSLVYPDESWKPDDEELTHVQIDDDIDISDEDSDFSEKKKSKLLSKFSIFLMIWAFILFIVSGILLISYYDYLERYQEAYEQSRPEYVIKLCIEQLESKDIDSIYSSITALPITNEFENDLSIKTYIANNTVSENLTFELSDNYTKDIPEYVIKGDNNFTATVILRELLEQNDEFGFSKWFISYFDYPFIPEKNVKVEVPNDAILYINDILVSSEYCYSKTNSSQIYIIKDFYATPSIIAFDNSGNSLNILYDDENDIYTVIK